VPLNPPPAVNNGLYNDLGRRWYEAFDDPVALLRAEANLKNPWAAARIRAKFGDQKVSVLDIGCGGGFLSNYLAAEGHRVTGLDLSVSSLAVAKDYDLSGKALYVEGNAYALPFADHSLEVVTAMDFLEHVEDPALVVKEVGRVLKPGGIFIFHTFNRNPLAYLLVIKAVEWFVKNTPPHMHVYHLFVKPAELAAYCQSQGMRIEEWKGIRPRLFRFSVLKALFTGIVPKDFSFAFTRSLSVSYCGVAVKGLSPVISD
jgi:2-polyprenyl-6-hydroxyphenyl methylase/3-demethylubiquinone-9 3-methyltransferase